MRIFRSPSGSYNWIATIAIGERYLNDWLMNAFPTWIRYADDHSLGLVVFESELIARDNAQWKKATWQKMLLGKAMREAGYESANVLYLDTDILISPLAPNIFDLYECEKIAVVSQVNNLYQPRDLTLRRLAFLRHTYLDAGYPLDSALFMPISKLFEYHGLKAFDDYFCAGMFLFNVSNHTDLMLSWFEKYPSGIKTLTGGGDEPHLNYELQTWGNLQWLPYEFQALWIYEVAWRYPFLFGFGRNNLAVIRECVEASLYVNHFLHFAGSWHESEMWKVGGFFHGEDKMKVLREYIDYLSSSVSGEPIGLVKPKGISKKSDMQ